MSWSLDGTSGYLSSEGYVGTWGDSPGSSTTYAVWFQVSDLGQLGLTRPIFSIAESSTLVFSLDFTDKLLKPATPAGVQWRVVSGAVSRVAGVKPSGAGAIAINSWCLAVAREYFVAGTNEQCSIHLWNLDTASDDAFTGDKPSPITTDPDMSFGSLVVGGVASGNKFRGLVGEACIWQTKLLDADVVRLYEDAANETYLPLWHIATADVSNYWSNRGDEAVVPDVMDIALGGIPRFPMTPTSVTQGQHNLPRVVPGVGLHRWM